MTIEVVALTNGTTFVPGDTLTRFEYQLQDENETPIFLVPQYEREVPIVQRVQNDPADQLKLHMNALNVDGHVMNIPVEVVSPAEGTFSVNPSLLYRAEKLELVVQFTKDKQAVYDVAVPLHTSDTVIPIYDEDYLWVG